MSVPTTVLVNGRWVTRYVDQYQVLAHNREPEVAKPKEPNQAPEASTLGLLTRTIVRTPVVKWIIPARVRHADRNDVLYITADSVEIKEAHGDYTLHHVASKDDFDSPIRAARICGLPRELAKPDINAIIHKEEHWNYDVGSNHPKDSDQSMDEDVDDHVKIENENPASGVSKDVDDEADAKSTDAFPLHKRTIPPQILVLALESGKLAFVYAVNGDSDNPHLITSQTALPRGNTMLEQLGERVAVDPKSRAVAVAAHEKFFHLYALRPMNELRKQVRKQPRIAPISSERRFDVDGTILKMEFLYPPQNDHGQVTLLLVVCKLGKSRLIWYEWNSASSLYQDIKPLSQVLPSDERMPLLLIPTVAFSAFILVCENRITVYKDILTGTPSRIIHNLHHRPEPEEPGTSKRNPIWVQWARVMRSTTHRAKGDGVYLCREDGIVHFLDLKYDLLGLIDSTHEVGKLGTNIDTSFAVLDVGPNRSDLLAAGGDGSEGGLWRFDPREHPQKISNRPNWTPAMDCSSTSIPMAPQENSPLIPGRQRIFTCVGKAKQGALTELRYGIPARRSLTIDLKDVLSGGILAVWAFRNLSEATSYVVLSHPKQTYLLQIHQDRDGDGTSVNLVEESQAIELNARTIAMRTTAEGDIIQITEAALRTASISATNNTGPQNHLQHRFANARVLAGCIGLPGFETLTLIALRSGDGCYLQLGIANNTYNVIGRPVALQTEPSSLAFTRVGNQIMALVGFLNGSLNVYMTEEDSKTLQLIGSHTFKDDFAICESIAVLLQDEDDDQTLSFTIHLACGMRNGSLHILQCQGEVDSYRVLDTEKLTFGNTPVSVFVADPEKNQFIIYSEDTLCSFEYSAIDMENAVPWIHRIWLTDDKEPELSQGSFSALAIAEVLGTSPVGSKAPEVIYVDRTSIHVATLDYASGPQNVHRRLTIGGTPIRIVYSERLNRLIVLSNEFSVLRSPRTLGNRKQPGKRALQPVITFLDPDGDQDEPGHDDGAMDIDNDDRSPTTSMGTHRSRNVVDYKPGEKFLGIIEWFPKLGDKEYHMLVVNTMIGAEVGGKASGRLLLFAIQATGDRVGVSLKKEASHVSPIYAVSSHPDRKSIVYCSNHELCILSLEPQAEGHGPKWSTPVRAPIRSPGRHITIEEPFIYVSTAGEGLAVFHQGSDSVQYVWGDTVSRHGLHHIHLPFAFIITADMGGSITGFKQPRDERIDNALWTHFEACLPHTVIRLQPILCPAWMQEPPTFEDEIQMLQIQWLNRERALIGISTTGTITQHTLLSKTVWPLLRFVQNLAERSPIICPFRDGPQVQHLDPARSTKLQFSTAVNGDILLRLLDRGGAELLRQLMDKVPSPRDEFVDFGSKDARWIRLRELCKVCCTSADLSWPPMYLMSQEELADKLCVWMKGLLRSVL